MKITENTEIVERILNSLKEGERKGFHVTDLIYCKRKVYYRKVGLMGEEDQSTLLKKTRGRALHALIEGSFLLESKEHIVEKDGVIGSIDVLGERPIELYTTSKSKVEPQSFAHKIRQLACYSHMLGVNSGTLVVFFLGKRYQIKAFDITFSKEELELNWSRILSKKKELEDAIAKSECPEPEPEYDWECKNCPYSAICSEVG